MSAEGRDAVLSAFAKFGFRPTATTAASGPLREAEDYDMICTGLNLFLTICGHGIALKESTPTLGDRVRQAEQLVVALENAGWSSGLKAHQISGLDWRALRSVILWAGDRADSRREDARREAAIRYDEILHRGRERSFRSRQLATNSRDAMKMIQEEEDEDVVPEELPKGVIDSKAVDKLEAQVQTQRVRIEEAVKNLAEITKQGNELRSRQSLDSDAALPRFDQIVRLVEENESLKSMEKEFKSTCRKERERLTSKIQGLEAEAIEDQEELNELRAAKARIESRLARARVSLASVSRREATEARIEDDAPTPEELLQFERRFGELYEQMTLKSDEQRRHLATFNSLATKLRLIQDQIQLLRSIRVGFEASQTSASSAAEFRSQFQTVLQGFERNLAKSKEKVAMAETKRSEAENELQILLVKQRRYYRAVRDLQDAFAQNEKLLSAAKQLR